VTIRLYSGVRAISDASSDITITRSRSINEKASVFDRTPIILRDVTF
jgi:hypothetical protein